MFTTAAKAWIAATVTLVATFVSARYGLSVPDTISTTVASLISSALAGFFTWLVPNAET